MTTFPELAGRLRDGVDMRAIADRWVRENCGFRSFPAASATSSMTNVITFDPSARVVENSATRRPLRVLLKISFVLSIAVSPAWLVMRKVRAAGRPFYVQERCP